MFTKEAYLLGKWRPNVQLISRQVPSPQGWERYSTSHEMQIIDSEKRAIGIIKLEKGLASSVPECSIPPVAWIRDIHLEEAYQHKGYGKAAYLELLKSLGDMPLHSAIINSDSAANIWRSLVCDGLAQEEYVEVNGQVRMVGYISLPEAVKSKLQLTPSYLAF